MVELSVLFGRPQSEQGIEDHFDAEALALEELQIDYWAIPLEPVVEGEVEHALQWLPEEAGRTWLYRGWMLRYEEYHALCEAIEARGERLWVDPYAFERARYLPQWAPHLEGLTPESRWQEGTDLDEAWELACELGPGPWIIKDHVKSAKELWRSACFIPAGADKGFFEEACRALIEHRAERFERGLVIRQYIELEPSRYRLMERALPLEHRLVFFDGALIAHAPYHDIDASLGDPHALAFIGQCIDSPFFVADVARNKDGEHVIIEINDGGTAIWPEQLDLRALYRRMADA